MLDGHGAQLPGLDHVDPRPVGDARNGESRHGGERVAVVERPGQCCAGLDEEALRLLCPLLIVDVGVRPEPLHDPAFSPRHRDGASEMPAVRTVGGAAKPELGLVGQPRRERCAPALERATDVLRVDALHPARLDELRER